MNLILQRSKEGICPICKVKEIKEKREVPYQSEVISICKKHPYLESPITLKKINEEIKVVRKANKYRKRKRRKR